MSLSLILKVVVVSSSRKYSVTLVLYFHGLPGANGVELQRVGSMIARFDFKLWLQTIGNQRDEGHSSCVLRKFTGSPTNTSTKQMWPGECLWKPRAVFNDASNGFPEVNDGRKRASLSRSNCPGICIFICHTCKFKSRVVFLKIMILHLL